MKLFGPESKAQSALMLTKHSWECRLRSVSRSVSYSKVLLERSGSEYQYALGAESLNCTGGGARVESTPPMHRQSLM